MQRRSFLQTSLTASVGLALPLSLLGASPSGNLSFTGEEEAMLTEFQAAIAATDAPEAIKQGLTNIADRRSAGVGELAFTTTSGQRFLLKQRAGRTVIITQ